MSADKQKKEKNLLNVKYPFNTIIICLFKECNQIRFTVCRSSVPSVVENVNIVIDCRGRRQFRMTEKYLYF